MSYVISIDQGTTSTRSILFDHKMNAINSSQIEFKQYFPKSGWVEHNPEDLWNTTVSTFKDVLKKSNLTPNMIAAIGITNQRETTVVWDPKTGECPTKAIVWQDRRTSDFCKRLKNQSLEEMIKNKTGLILDPYFSSTKLNWILSNIPDGYNKAKNGDLIFGTVDSYLIWKLTGGRSHVTDATNASRTMLFNIKDYKWDEEICDLMNIPIKMLPKVLDSADFFGEVDKDIFGSSIPILGVAGDQQAATIGQACFKKGQSKSTYGTGCFLLMNIGEKFQLSKNRLLTTVAFKINGKKMFCYEGSIFVAGSAIQWLRDNLKFIKDSSETDKLYKKANKDESLFFVPALTGLGAPYWNPNARGTFFGITRNTSKEDIIKATLDSLSFQTYELIECMEKDSKTKISEIRVDGGMVKNNSFLQSLANISQIKIIRPSNVETTSLGAAYLAAIQSGYLKNTSQISKLWKKDKTVKANINKSISTSSISKWKSIINVVNNFY